MSVNTGFNDISTGEMHSEQFDFRGGYLAYLVENDGSSLYQLEILFPSGHWQKIGALMNSNAPFKVLLTPAGTYRIGSTVAVAGAKLYWAHCPTTFTDALL